MPSRFGLQVAAAALAAAIYLCICHWLMVRPGGSPWNVVAVIGPMICAASFGAWNSGHRWLGLLGGGAMVALVGQALLGAQWPTHGVYLADHVGFNGCLALGFGATLRPGRTPLITALARRVHPTTTPSMEVYTRQCTLAWTLYFVGVALVSILVFTLASFEHWAFFSNLVAPLSIPVMFGGEYFVRYRLHPEFERASMGDAIRSYMQGAAK